MRREVKRGRLQRTRVGPRGGWRGREGVGVGVRGVEGVQGGGVEGGGGAEAGGGARTEPEQLERGGVRGV